VPNVKARAAAGGGLHGLLFDTLHEGRGDSLGCAISAMTLRHVCRQQQCAGMHCSAVACCVVLLGWNDEPGQQAAVAEQSCSCTLNPLQLYPKPSAVKGSYGDGGCTL